MDDYDKDTNAVVGALDENKNTVFRVVHRGVLQNLEFTTIARARDRLKELIARWNLLEEMRR